MTNPTENNMSQESSASEPVTSTASDRPATAGGPLNLEQIRRMREAQQTEEAQSQPKRSDNRPPRPPKSQKHGGPEGAKSADSSEKSDEDQPEQPRRPKRQEVSQVAPRVEIPNVRGPLSSDLERELEAAFDEADLNKLLVGDSNLKVGIGLEEGQRYTGRVIKIHNENVFIALGGPDEGVVPLLQFHNAPKVGDQVDCVIRGFNAEEGMYNIGIPGEAVSVSDWADIDEGSVVEAKVESANTGGLACKVGNIDGFIPMSQIADYRVETPADFVGQKLLCVVTESSPRRGNLVLSHRAILEREKEEKKKDRLAKLEVGQAYDGVVRKVMDFGAFVDIGGLDGLIHVSQLSWERIKHPSEVVKEGDKIKVRIERVDPDTGKIGLSYRSLQDHPWENIDAQFPIGTVVHGTVSRIANFGAFVKLATGIEGLIHVSELANRRVTNVGNIVQEGQPVEVKILSVDKESQRIGLSLKQAAAPAEEEAASAEAQAVEATPAPKPSVKKRSEPLKGGMDRPTGGEGFGLKW
jgi:predicted RNA-binding protein with RPS1 domain